jgi:hypothetical protein
MKFKAKTFQKLQFILFLSFLVLFSCQKEKERIIDDQQFIEIYARLLIIYEMNINKDYHDRLVEEVFDKFNVTAAQVDSTVTSLNAQPKKWVEILTQVRERIHDIREDMKPGQPGKVTSTEPKNIDRNNKQKIGRKNKESLQQLERENLKKQKRSTLPEPE